ncbi:mucin-16-like [Monodelphis domestica]|uniref:mucin-16-like n=1 Tax=Monodelphis domestica TaxID=13616 RepID=UPI0024E24746|nr:mucin-16-like [Monodelphis domestica]
MRSPLTPVSTVIPTAAGSFNSKTFTINFTITNMFYKTKMGQRGSSTFRVAEFVLQHLFKVLFERSSLGSQYSGCSVTLLRSMNNGKATGVEVICSYQEFFSISVLDKKKIYQELSQQTNGITRLGGYILDEESLYVDGYNPQMPTPSTNTGDAVVGPVTPAQGHGAPRLTVALIRSPLTPVSTIIPTASGRPRLETFTMNFTINNTLYTEDMEQPYSEKFSSTERILHHLLRGLFKNSSLASSYTRPVKDGEATGVDVVCAHYKDPSRPVLYHVKVYLELSNQTYGIIRLGPYTLNSDSLFLIGYNDKHSGTISRPSRASEGRMMTTAGESQTIIITISSPAVRTHSVLATTAAPTTACAIDLEKITVPASSALPELMVAPFAWSGVATSPSETTLIAEICTPLGAGTGGGSPIGVPSHLTSLDTTTSTTVFPCPNVPPAQSTMCSTISLQSATILCRVSREERKPKTSLDTSASETTAMATARVWLALTKTPTTMDISRGAEAVVLSTSDLPTSSAVPLIPTDKVSTRTTMTTIAHTAAGSSYSKTFTLNFTITNMFYTPDMGERGSNTFKAAENVLQVLLKFLFGMSNLGSHYSACSVNLLRSLKNGTATGVDVLCTFQEDSSNPVLNKEKVYWELTEQIQRRRLKHVLIERDSLFVDGYHHKQPGIISTKKSEIAVGPVTHIPDHGAPGDMTSVTSSLYESTVGAIAAGSSYSKTFTLNFTITNMFYTPDMGERGSNTFKAAENVLQVLLKFLFGMSNLGSHYSACSVNLLRSLKNGTATGVGVLCTFQEDSSNPVLNKEKVYWELTEQIQRRRLKHVLIERDSLFVDGYHHKQPGIISTKKSEIAVGPVTLIPDYGAPGDMTSVTSGLLTYESTVGAIDL